MDNKQPIAAVNGKPIFESDIDELLASMGQQAQRYNNPEGRKMVLEQVIAQKLFLEEARKNMYEFDPDFKAQMAIVKDQLLTQYSVNKALGNLTVSDEDAKKFYDENPDQFKGSPKYSASHILVADEKQANDILGKINAGEMAFEEAAKEYSTCPSGKEGGNLGEFGQGQMVPEFENACSEMNEGELKGPVKTQFGYHLIRLNKKTASQPITFAQVKEQIKQMLLQQKQQQAYQTKVNQLKILFPVDKY